MDRLTRFSFRNSAVVVLIALIVFFAGLQSANQLKKETMPDISVPYIMVVTIYPGAAPHDVYTDVTDPLEKAIRGVGGVKMVTASSGDSYSAVIAEFNYSEDMDKAETNVNKAMQAVKLPKTAMAPTVSRIGFSARPVLKLAVVGAQESDHDALRSQLSDKFVPALKGVSGVGKAEIVADTPYAVHIKFDAKKLAPRE